MATSKGTIGKRGLARFGLLLSEGSTVWELHTVRVRRWPGAVSAGARDAYRRLSGLSHLGQRGGEGSV